MPAAEIFLSAFVTVLFEKLASGELLKLARLGGIDDKLKKWRKKLGIIDSLLGDAEEQQVTKRTVQEWLEDLRDVAYDIDDVLDELETEVLRRTLMVDEEHGSSGRTSKVWKLIPTCCVTFTPTAILFNLRISSKIDEITSRLDDLEDRKSDLNLIQNFKGRSSRIEEGWRTSSSLVVESRVRGRVEDKDAVLKLLLEDSNSNNSDDVHVIPIVGMGGLGKTTLVQLVYNDEQVKGHFDLRVWLCVGEDFDLFKMTNIIYHSVAEDCKIFKDLNSVQVSLKEKLSKKRFLIVLDDVWNENYGKWDRFRSPFLVGAPGSTIIVTTRNCNIAQFMGSVEPYQLQPLQDTDCLSLIAQHALRRPNFDMHPDLKDVGEEIAKKCKGLPLAATTLGGLLCSKVSLKSWKDVLRSKVWDLPTGSNDIVPALRLSYHQLPPHLKHLFAYCSIFPKDYQFDVHELILFWMAEGFLKKSGKKQMEELGLEYFHELLSRSFFQCCGDNESRYVMHDLMNDLAQFVAGEICFSLDNNVEYKEPYAAPLNSRHSSFIRHEYDTFKKFKVFDGVRNLRTFLPLPLVNPIWQSFYLSSMVIIDLLPKLQCLRVLSLSGYFNITEVPNSVGDLKHLRYLNLSYTSIMLMPESVCDLHNLQTLLLQGCRELIQLPKNIRNLLNLRHLDISRTSALKEMPFGFGMLKRLRTLSKIVVNDGDGLKLYELKDLEDLQGRFCIDGMQNVKNVEDAIVANLSGKQGIKDLVIQWSSNSDDSQREGLDREVLELLKPQDGLARLQIESYRGTEFPSWIVDPSFSNMVHLTLSNCRECTSLPSVGHLHSLRELFVIGLDGVKVVGAEFLGAVLPGVSSFHSLETLSFQAMAGWEEWSVHLANNVEVVFPRLAKLELSNCPMLIKVSLPQIPSLVRLELKSCSEVVLISMIRLGLVKTLHITDISGLTQLDEAIIQHLGELEDLCVSSCVGMKYLWQEEVACQRLVKLRKLVVSRCRRLVSFGEREQMLPHNLEMLDLYECHNLEQMPSCCKSLRESVYTCNTLRYPSYSSLKSEEHQAMSMTQSSRGRRAEGFPNLQVLGLQFCSGLTWLPTGKKLPTSLKELCIAGCVDLEEPEEEEEGLESRLETIIIEDWKNLKSLPKGWLSYFVHLTTMKIYKCQGIESFPKRCFPISLRHLTIHACRNLKYLCDDDDNIMQSLASLQELKIFCCKNLVSFPNGIWPPNLEYLQIGGVKRPITEWGLHRLPTSLVQLIFWGEIQELVSFSELGSQLVTMSLTYLGLKDLENLESLSIGLQNLTSLQQLHIDNCPKLQSFPDMLLPDLSCLVINGCPLLKERCRMEKNDYWPSISHIPCVGLSGGSGWLL